MNPENVAIELLEGAEVGTLVDFTIDDATYRYKKTGNGVTPVKVKEVKND